MYGATLLAMVRNSAASAEVAGMPPSRPSGTQRARGRVRAVQHAVDADLPDARRDPLQFRLRHSGTNHSRRVEPDVLHAGITLRDRIRANTPSAESVVSL